MYLYIHKTGNSESQHILIKPAQTFHDLEVFNYLHAANLVLLIIVLLFCHLMSINPGHAQRNSHEIAAKVKLKHMLTDGK